MALEVHTLAAPARPLGLRIVDLKAAFHDGINPVNRGVLKLFHVVRMEVYLNAVKVENVVFVIRTVFKLKHVLVPRASPAAESEAKPIARHIKL